MRTAAHLYAECDGIEFLRSACKLDMRFVPEDQVGLLCSTLRLCLSKPNAEHLGSGARAGQFAGTT